MGKHPFVPYIRFDLDKNPSVVIPFLDNPHLEPRKVLMDPSTLRYGKFFSFSEVRDSDCEVVNRSSVNSPGDQIRNFKLPWRRY